MDSARTESVDLACDLPRQCGEIVPAGLITPPQFVAVGNDDGDRVGILVVVDDDLVDQLRCVGDRLLHAFGAVFFAVGGDQQAFETSQHIEESVVGQVAHVARMEPAVAHGVGRRFGVFPVTGHDILAADDDLGLSDREELRDPLRRGCGSRGGCTSVPDEPKRHLRGRGELVEMTGVASERP